MDPSDIEVGFPFRLDSRGRAADPDWEEHVRQMIELVLFTVPGERVNRPDFGCGLLELVFSPQSDQEAAVTQKLIEGSLQRWLGDVISVGKLEVDARDTTLDVRLEYTLVGVDERAIYVVGM